MQVTILFLIGWIMTALGDLVEREWTKTVAVAGRTWKVSSLLTAAGVVFFLVALFNVRKE